MTRDKDDQLQPFFQQQGTNDPEYLKRYVKEHPENKMAWYLLGREYATKGQHAKANYCFAQAGEVYAAFEESPSVQRTEPALTAGGQDAPERQEKTSIIRTSRRVLLGLAALFFLLYIPKDHDDRAHRSLPKMELSGSPSSKQTSPKSDEMKRSAVKAGDSSNNTHANVKIFYTSAASKTLPLEEALKQIVMPESRKSDRSIVVQALTSKDKRWVNWTRQPVYLLSAMTSKSGGLSIVYHEAGRCNCQADPDESVKTIYRSWNSIQEQKLILHSAITAYELINKRKPTKIEQLNGKYPNNILSGLTPMMKRLYAEYKGANLLSSRPLLMDVREQQQPGKHGISKTVSVTSGAEPFTRPLEIIVDKLHHRLALVSGNIVIRNYAVGLGGSRTPEGTFTITEKVRNPNGKSSGDFGSRGMTLSNTLYAIHGTDEPSSIGKDRSKGCVRMKNEDIEELFDMAPLGTKVIIRKGGLPQELIKGDRRFVMPAMNKETNPLKKYKWLD